jgi:hypothetical protein
MFKDLRLLAVAARFAGAVAGSTSSPGGAFPSAGPLTAGSVGGGVAPAQDLAWRHGRDCRGAWLGALARGAAFAEIGFGLVAGYERRETPPFNSKRRLRRSL